MDDNSDADNSLTDLHHGLDSSLDESSSGLSKQLLATQNVFASMDTASEVGVAEDQMCMLQDMVVEMKEGFKTAMKELAKIQDKDEGETYHSKKMQQQQQRQLDDLTETMHEIKDQLNSLTKSVKQIKDEQKTLKDNLEEVRSNRGSSQESKTRNDRDRLDLANDFSSPEDWNGKLSELPTEFEERTGSGRLLFETDDNDVTVTACKSLILTQALRDKCLKLNLSHSSDEDEDQESRRVSYYTPKTAVVAADQIENRRHSMPAGVGPKVRAKVLGTVALRQKAVKELADSERDYCSKLWSLLHTYLTPLQTAGFLSARELGMLFPPYLDQMYAEHCHICTSLQDRLVHWTYMGTVADLLARITDSHNSDSVLSLYKEYVDDLLSAVTCLRRIQAQSSKFRSFLKAVKRSTCQSEDLMSLLLAPVQHIPKYLLQLQQVLHHTPSTHPDFQPLQTSLCRLRSFVDQLNEELSGTAEVLNQDRHAWSGSNSGQMLSARDSGVHSNSTEDDNTLPTKAFSKAKRSHVPSEWLDDPYLSVHHHKSDDIRQRYARATTGRFSALSQPDLTVYNGLNSLGSDPHIFAHIPRSRSTIPAGGFDSGDEVARGRQYRKFKIKRRTQSPGDYTPTTKGHLHRSLSPQVRPSSAIDFLSHSHLHQQFQHQSNYRDVPVQSRKPQQYAERQPRAHSVLGPHAVDLNHKPNIISRKHLRRSQPPIPSSSNFWAETTTSSTLPFRVGHQRMPISARDLLPKRPSLYNNTSDMLDGDDEQEEDDTRASDTHSLGTNGSHPYSSGQCSNNSHDLELEFYQGHSSVHNPLTARQAHSPGHSPKFSSAEVTASLARKLYDAQQETTTVHDCSPKDQVCNDGCETKALPLSVAQPSGSSLILSSQVNGSDSVRELMTPSNGIDSNVSVNPIKSELKENDESLHNGAVLTNRSIFNNEFSDTSFPQERDEGVSLRNNNMETVIYVGKSMDGGGEDDNDEIKQISQTNRQFLLSLSARSPILDRVDQDSNFSGNSISEAHAGNWASSASNKNHQPWSSSDTSTSSSPSVRPDLNRARAYLMSRSRAQETLTLNGSTDAPNTESGHLLHRYSQSLSMNSGNKDKDIVSSEAISLTSSQKNRLERSLTTSSSTATYHSPLPASSNNTTNLSKITVSSLDNQQYHDSTRRTSCTGNVVSVTAQIGEESTNSKQNNGIVEHVGHYNDRISYTDSFELPPLEVDDHALDGDKGGRKGDARKKLKDGGKFNSSASPPKSIDDPVNARKKMHFKSSIKNLFSKKKGQVILADVEREVVKQMATTAVKGTMSKSKEHSRKTRVGNLFGNNNVIVYTPQTTMKESVVETQAWKRQCGSNSSLTKASKKFLSETKQSKPQSDAGKKELNSSECEQSQQQQKLLDCLRTHNKRHGIVVDCSDAQFTNTLDLSFDSASTAKLDKADNRYLSDDYHSQGRNGLTMFQSSQQRPQSHFTSGPGKSGADNLCNRPATSFNQKCMPKHCQSQTAQQELTGLRNSHIDEADHLKSTPDVGKNQTSHKNEQANIFKNGHKAEKYHGQHWGESHAKRSHFSSNDLCLYCQKCDARQKEKADGNIGDLRFGPSSLRNSITGSDKHSAAGNSVVKPLVSDTVGRTSSNVHQNDLNEGKKLLAADKVMQFPLAVEPASFNFTESFKPCAGPKLAWDNSKICLLTSSYSCPEEKQDQLGDRCKHCTLSSTQKQATEYRQGQSTKLITNNMPDVTKISQSATSSDKTERQSTLTEVSSQKSCAEAAVDLVSAASSYLGESEKLFSTSSEVYNSMDRSSSSLSNKCDGKTPQNKIPLLPEILVTTSRPGQYFSVSPQARTSETRSTFTKEQKASDLLPRSRSSVLPAAILSKECSQSFVVEETQNEIIVKRFSLEDRELFEHRYRLYYDDEASSCRNLKRLENPKSLKALSASSVIAENFKQLPRDTNINYGKAHKTSAQQPSSSSPSDVLLERKPPRANLTGGDGVSEPKLIEASGPKFPLQSQTGSNLSKKNALLTDCNSQMLSQFSNYRPIYGGSMVVSQEKLSADNHTDIPQTNSSQMMSHAAEVNVLCDKSLDLKDNLRSKQNENTLKLFPTSRGLDIDINSLRLDVSERSGTQTTPFFADAPYSDESSSYKPKNPPQTTNSMLSDSSECQGSRLMRGERVPIEYHPHFSLKGSSSTQQLATPEHGSSSKQQLATPEHGSSSKQELATPEHDSSSKQQLAPPEHGSTSTQQPATPEHGFSSKQQLATPEHSTNSSILNVPSCAASIIYNNDSHLQVTINNEHRSKGDTQRLESSPRPQSGNTSAVSLGSFRTSSPSDFFSIRPYVDYTASKASSDSGILALSDHIRSSTPNGMKSASKGSSSDKLDKVRKHAGSRKARSGSEKDSMCCKSPNKCTESVNGSDDAEHCFPNYSRRGRHSDGAKFSSQEHRFYQPQYPRYSADSSSLISNAFLQKMAHLPKHTVRSASISHDEGSHSNSFTRHVSIHGDLHRKAQSPNGIESNVLPSTHCSRNFRITSPGAKSLPIAHTSSSHASKDGIPHINYEYHRSRSSSAKADVAILQTSPDLLLSNDGLKEESITKEKSPLSKRAQSFFSKLTHSPISLFYRDSKSSNPPK